jgi:hypothetical protein
MDGEDRELVSTIVEGIFGKSVTEETLNLIYALVMKNLDS